MGKNKNTSTKEIKQENKTVRETRAKNKKEQIIKTVTVDENINDMIDINAEVDENNYNEESDLDIEEINRIIEINEMNEINKLIEASEKNETSNINEINETNNLNHNVKVINTTTRSKRNTQKTNNLIEEVEDNEVNFTSINAKTFQPMLAETYDGSQEIINWLMSEKLDGVRCTWNGSSLYSRNGNIFYPPDFFKKDFPKDMILDGELFLERNEFSKTISIVKKQYKHEGWEKIKYIVFDAPKVKGKLSQRLKVAEERIKKIDSPYIVFHKQEVLKSVEELDKKMEEVIALKGEGVIVRDPDSLYENRRSSKMLKVKKFHDAEATVIGHQKGEGRCIGMLGALIVVNDDGVQFKIGSGFDDSQRRNPPKIGSRVTYKYFEISKDSKKPRFPTFLRVHPGM